MDALDQTAREASRANPSPANEMMVSQMDQVFMVSVTLMLKYSFTSQKPPSLTCEKMGEPAPVAMASNSGCTPGVCNAMGATMPAAVVMATVAEPVASRMSAASSPCQQQQGHMRAAWRTAMIAWETPLSCRMRPNPPPAPISSVMVAVGARHSLLKRRIVSRLKAAHGAQRDKAEQGADQQGHIVIAQQAAGLLLRWLPAAAKVSAQLPTSIRTTGSRMVQHREPEAGQLAVCIVIGETVRPWGFRRGAGSCGAMSFA